MEWAFWGKVERTKNNNASDKRGADWKLESRKATGNRNPVPKQTDWYWGTTRGWPRGGVVLQCLGAWICRRLGEKGREREVEPKFAKGLRGEK